MFNAEAARTVLRTAGVRLTPQRLMVVDALVDNRSHPTVEQIYNIVRERYPTVSLATVYHTVALLARHKLILELHGGKDGLRCDPTTEPHAHAYCQECGQVLDVTLNKKQSIPTENPEGFQVMQVEISLYGLCPTCQLAETDPA